MPHFGQKRLASIDVLGVTVSTTAAAAAATLLFFCHIFFCRALNGSAFFLQKMGSRNMQREHETGAGGAGYNGPVALI